MSVVGGRNSAMAVGDHKHPAVMDFDPSVNKSAVGYLPTVGFWIFKKILDGNRPSVTFQRFGWPNWPN